MNKSQAGFSLILFLIISIIIGAVGFAGWYVWNQPREKSANKINSVNSFETCAAAGNPIMASYPEQCRANGKVYTNNHQNQTNR